MSFAERLGLLAVEGRKDWDKYLAECVEDFVERIKQACEKTARTGCSSTQVRLNIPPRTRSSAWPWAHAPNGRQISVCMQEEVGKACTALGFTSVSVHPSPSGLHLSTFLKWAVPDHACDPPPQPRRGNHSIVCGICTQTRPCVRLSPCGHLLCIECSERSTTECPFCRQRIHEHQDVFEP